MMVGYSLTFLNTCHTIMCSSSSSSLLISKNKVIVDGVRIRNNTLKGNVWFQDS